MTLRKGIWLSFPLAAREIERRLGVTWGAAQKTLIEACQSGEIETLSNYSGQGPDVFDVDFYQWLNSRLNQPAGGKQSRILRLLAKMFPTGVPSRDVRPREGLRAELLRRDPTLEPPTLKTLQKAIVAHNRQLGNASIPSVSH
jgi:hypothetical protein